MQILGEHRHGAFAEYVAMPSHCFFRLPDDADLTHAGLLMTAYLTAWRMLFGKKTLRPGESVLVVGIGGGVAVACLQLARMIGARVLVTSSSDEKIARAVALGAEGGVNYRKDRVSKAILEMTRGAGVDMVIDSVGEASWGESLRSLRRGGRLITCGATTGSNPPSEIQRLFIRQLEIYGSTGGSIGEFRELLDVFGRDLLAPVIDSTFAMRDIRAAFDRLSAGRAVRQNFAGCLMRRTPLAPPSGGERERSAEIAGVARLTDRGVVRDAQFLRRAPLGERRDGGMNLFENRQRTCGAGIVAVDPVAGLFALTQRLHGIAAEAFEAGRGKRFGIRLLRSRTARTAATTFPTRSGNWPLRSKRS